MELEVTKIDLRISGSGNTLGFGTLEFNNFIVMQFRLMNGEKGPFIKLGESKQGRNGKWYDSAYVTNDDLRKIITTQVIEKYNEVLTKSRIKQDEPVSA